MVSFLSLKGGGNMPTETFLKLAEEKKHKIIEAAKKEFSRVPIEDVSIKNIVEEAEIARGSFYQYFTSKQDVLQYLLELKVKDVDTYIVHTLEQSRWRYF